MTDQQQQPPAPATTASEAIARLDTLRADKSWSEKLVTGDSAVTKEWNDLHHLAATGDDVDVALSGALPDVPSSSVREMASTADMLRDAGFTPKAIREVLSNQEAPQADHDRAAAFKNQALKNPEFRKRWLGGDPDAAREMLAANAILSLPIKKEAAA
jgi:hypothetical protein